MITLTIVFLFLDVIFILLLRKLYNEINKPCPDCGYNLLTQEEYNSCLKNINIVKKIDIIVNIFKWINPIYYIKLMLGKRFEKYDEMTISKRYANPSTNEKDTITITTN